jgi:hypothetical protein
VLVLAVIAKVRLVAHAPARRIFHTAPAVPTAILGAVLCGGKKNEGRKRSKVSCKPQDRTENSTFTKRRHKINKTRQNKTQQNSLIEQSNPINGGLHWHDPNLSRINTRVGVMGEKRKDCQSKN